ncbi:unnamed protein product [Mesocestoides corti]|uniref:WD_REPEATS_REGION domain-containing protein n=1 Tax=Mesocestoides corti TaxID=53468 RepID=A0A0R3U6K1_MESCO|nr:unnamed protein product [Mesocestoides corti]
MVYSLWEAAQSLTLSPQARCLVGLYDSQVSPLADQTENARFLVGCQSVKPNGSQVHLITLEDGDVCQSFCLKSQSFIHPDGEVVGLTVLPAAPLLFVSVYSSISENKTEVTSGARIWRLPPPSSPADSGDEKEIDFADQPVEQLEFVSSLPCDDFSSVKKVAAHPSETCTDFACVLGPPLPGTSHMPNGVASGRGVFPGSSFLAILKASSSDGNDYAIDSCVQLRLPSGNTSLEETQSTKGVVSTPANAIRWSPHRNASTLAVAFDSGVLGIDTRCMQPCFWLGDIHWPCVRDLDFNPNQDHILATGGDDGCVSVWDLRLYGSSGSQNSVNPKHEGFSFRTVTSGGGIGLKPLTTLSAHSHWIWSVRYHPTRDQLLLSGGSDSCVCLYGLPSLSSDAKEVKPQGAAKSPPRHCSPPSSSSPHGSDISIESLEDGLLAKLDQHEESVYAVDWSPVDPWIFASVNYDGHFIVNQVPHKIKLGILLQKDNDEEDDLTGDDFDKV